MLIYVLSHLISYWLTVGIFYIMDRWLESHGVSKYYKITPVDKTYWKYYSASVYSSFKNQALITIPIIMNFSQCITSSKAFHILEITKIPVYIVAADFWFYFVHRAFHTRFLYPLHKYHHRIHTTTAPGALDAKWFEHIIANLGSASFGPALFPGHYLTLSLWFALATANTCIAHSGFKFVKSDHALHHSTLKVNFGNYPYIWDRLFGSYKKND